jgi:hypothetical protein
MKIYTVPRTPEETALLAKPRSISTTFESKSAGGNNQFKT